MRSLLVLAFTCMVFVPVPALSQPSQDGPSGAQYDQYGGPVPGVGGNAVQDAIVALDAIRDSDEEAQAAGGDADTAAERPNASGRPDAASAEAVVTESSAEAQDENASAGTAVTEDGTNEDGTAAQDETVSDLEKLPDTGGPSPLWLGTPLLCAGSLLACRILP